MSKLIATVDFPSLFISYLAGLPLTLQKYEHAFHDFQLARTSFLRILKDKSQNPGTRGLVANFNAEKALFTIPFKPSIPQYKHKNSRQLIYNFTYRGYFQKVFWFFKKQKLSDEASIGMANLWYRYLKRYKCTANRGTIVIRLKGGFPVDVHEETYKANRYLPMEQYSTLTGYQWGKALDEPGDVNFNRWKYFFPIGFYDDSLTTLTRLLQRGNLLKTVPAKLLPRPKPTITRKNDYKTVRGYVDYKDYFSIPSATRYWGPKNMFKSEVSNAKKVLKKLDGGNEEKTLYEMFGANEEQPEIQGNMARPDSLNKVASAIRSKPSSAKKGSTVKSPIHIRFNDHDMAPKNLFPNDEDQRLIDYVDDALTDPTSKDYPSWMTSGYKFFSEDAMQATRARIEKRRRSDLGGPVAKRRRIVPTPEAKTRPTKKKQTTKHRSPSGSNPYVFQSVHELYKPKEPVGMANLPPAPDQPPIQQPGRSFWETALNSKLHGID
jgi:hypothetical protein